MKIQIESLFETNSYVFESRKIELSFTDRFLQLLVTDMKGTTWQTDSLILVRYDTFSGILNSQLKKILTSFIQGDIKLSTRIISIESMKELAVHWLKEIAIEYGRVEVVKKKFDWKLLRAILERNGLKVKDDILLVREEMIEFRKTNPDFLIVVEKQVPSGIKLQLISSHYTFDIYHFSANRFVGDSIWIVVH